MSGALETSDVECGTGEGCWLPVGHNQRGVGGNDAEGLSIIEPEIMSSYGQIIPCGILKTTGLSQKVRNLMVRSPCLGSCDRCCLIQILH